jgi:membrane protease YdiL (CAAX protease family)
MGSVGLGRVETAAQPRSNGRLVAWLTFVLLLALVNWAGRIGGGQTPKDAAYRWDLGIGAVIQFAFILVVIAFIARGDWGLLALRRPRSWTGALGTAILVLVAVNIVSVALEPILHPGREQGLTPTRWEPSHAPQFALFAFAVVVMAPITEELAFRGLGYGLLRPFGLAVAIGGSAVLWALAHGLLDALPVITMLGIGLGWLRYRQDSTIPGMILHGAFNGIALAVSLAT